MSQRKINVRIFELYKKVYHDVRVIPGFRVPKNDSWPMYFHGYNLGNYANTLRAQFKEDRSVFDSTELGATTELGFDWKIHTPEVEQVLFACKLYKRKFRSCDVPSTYKIPQDESYWPDCVHNLKLGEILNNIRLHGFHKPIHHELKRLGFKTNKDAKNVHVITDYQRLTDALVAYKQVHGNLKVDRQYIVEEDDHRFPKHTWGLKLGYIINGVQKKGHFSEHIDELRELGLEVNTNELVQDFTRIYSALATYKSLNGDLQVPHQFKIPHGSPDYPQSAWDMKLGAIVKGIRKNDTFSVYRPQLEELGFVYATKNAKQQQIVEID